jgi:putative ABC transport system permease protein
MADSLHKGVGDSIDLSGSRFKIQGIYTSGISWEEMGGVISLRDAQVFVGRPRKVMLLSVKLHDPTQAEAVTQKINTQFPVVYAALSGEFVSQLPDMKNSNGMSSGMSIMAIFVGGLGVMNTMLMAVLERTREIGVLRALGWRRKQVLGMILRESLLLAFLGSILGVIFGFGLGWALGLTPWYGDAIKLNWSVELFGRALLVALVLGLVGGIYPAYRATRLQPVEALRYE